MCISTFEYVPVMCDLVRLRLREQTTTGGKKKKHNLSHEKIRIGFVCRYHFARTVMFLRL